MSKRDGRILELIRKGHATSRALAQALKMTRPQASYALYHLAEIKMIKRGRRISSDRPGPPLIRWIVIEAAQ